MENLRQNVVSLPESLISENLEKKENLMAVLRSRRVQNFKSQFKSVILEGYEIFGSEVVESVISECREIFEEFKKIANE